MGFQLLYVKWKALHCEVKYLRLEEFTSSFVAVEGTRHSKVL